MNLPTLAEIEAAAQTVYRAMPPTPQYRWPLVCEHVGTEVWLKHENHTPVGAFKLRGGLVYFSRLEKVNGVIAATRGNHGQSVAFCARQYGMSATIVVPHGNSVEKNAAMRSLGATLIEHGHDFQAALEHAQSLAGAQRLHMVPSFHPWLVAGVASASLELFHAVPDLQTLYVPIGLGSGICAAVAARNTLGSRAEIVGVVSAHARAYAVSFAQRRPVAVQADTRLADGMAVRTPDAEALELMLKHVDRIVEVSDDEVAQAIAILFQCTHNCAEGAGAAPFAAIRKERARLAGRKVAAVLSGGNIDREVFASVLAHHGSR
ncbi:MAG TPA: threonine dehydratase [Burkholderiales bacterium]|jgi:threonine dehydratase|nr:threonine dehydratase [Burkholderiales bacterium]